MVYFGNMLRKGAGVRLKLFKYIVLAMLFSFVFCNIGLANDNAKFGIGSSKELVDVTKLYIVDGKDKYAGYKALKGYPGEDRFQVYFQRNTNGSITSLHTTYEDLRGINLDEVIEWEMDGKPMRHFRKDIYQLFSDSIKLYSNRPTYTGTFSQDWHRRTFGRVYEEWLDGMAFSQDAQTLLKHYFEYKYPTPPNNRYDLRDMDL